MKTITIYKRTILERTGYKKYPYKEVTQVSIVYDGKEFKNHNEDTKNIRLRIKFDKTFECRSKQRINDYIEKLGRKESELFEKETIKRILSEVE